MDEQVVNDEEDILVYEPPRLEVLGSVVDLTEIGQDSPLTSLG